MQNRCFQVLEELDLSSKKDWPVKSELIFTFEAKCHVVFKTKLDDEKASLFSKLD